MSKRVSEEHLLAYGAYTQVADSLQHYNHIQSVYRVFASTWLLATFVGVGYSLSSFEVNLPFHPLLIIAFICLASSTGVALIWYMDMVVCEKLIAAIVFEGIELEEKYPWLPQMYHNVEKIGKLISYVSLKSIFYIGCFSILFITMGSSLTTYFYLFYSLNLFILPAVTLLFMLLNAHLVIASAKKNDPYLKIKKRRGASIG